MAELNGRSMAGAIVILAAGRSERFGTRSKQLALLGGKPLVCHPTDVALRTDVERVQVVLGHDADAVRDVLPDDPRLWAVVNPSFEAGQSTSIRAGLESLPDGVHFAVFLLGDQPEVRTEVVRDVVAAMRSGVRVARAVHADGPSHPVGFHRGTWPLLMALEGDRGAREVLQSIEVTAVWAPGPRPSDVDTPDDLERCKGTDF